MTIEEMKVKRKELGLSCRELAELGDLPLATVQKVFSGATKAPRSKTIQSLENVFGKFTEKEITGAIRVMQKQGANIDEIIKMVTEMFGVTREYVLDIMKAQVA